MVAEMVKNKDDSKDGSKSSLPSTDGKSSSTPVAAAKKRVPIWQRSSLSIAPNGEPITPKKYMFKRLSEVKPLKIGIISSFPTPSSTAIYLSLLSLIVLVLVLLLIMIIRLHHVSPLIMPSNVQRRASSLLCRSLVSVMFEHLVIRY
jgi:hypothetical protein